MESVWSVSKLSTESVGSRRQLVANCIHTADADATKQFASAVCTHRRRDETRQFRLIGVGGVYWASGFPAHNLRLHDMVVDLFSDQIQSAHHSPKSDRCITMIEVHCKNTLGTIRLSFNILETCGVISSTNWIILHIGRLGVLET